MIIRKLSLPRRTFLRGVGAAVALPLLDAMVPGLSANGAEPVKRLGFIYLPNGAVMPSWTPRKNSLTMSRNGISRPSLSSAKG